VPSLNDKNWVKFMTIQKENTTNATAFLDEDGLSGGNPGGINDLPGAPVTATGLLSFDFASGIPATNDPFRWDLSGLPSLKSGGKAVTFSVSNDGLVLTGRDDDNARVVEVKVVDLSAGTYEANLFRAFDHSGSTSEDDIILQVGFELTDNSGEVTSDRLAVFIDDDSPIVDVTVPDEIDSGKTTTGSWSISSGADGFSEVFVKLPGDTARYEAGASIDTGNGTLVVEDNGAWTFQADSNVTSANDTLTFTLVGIDGDGDQASTTVTTTITPDAPPTTVETDGDPSTTTPIAAIDEDGLSGGAEGGQGDIFGQFATMSGSLNYSFGGEGPGSFSWSLKGLPSLSSGGETLHYTLSGNGRSLLARTPDGERVLSIQLIDLDAGIYKVALAKPLDHSDTASEDNIQLLVGYTIVDAAGDQAAGMLNVLVNDDSPLAVHDVAITDTDSSVTVNVLANDRPGGDDSELTDVVVAGGSQTGTAVINADGTITLTPNSGFNGDAIVTYTLTDGDGDTGTGQLTVSVEGSVGPVTPDSDGDPTTSTPKAVVDEDGLSGGVAGGVRDAPTMATVHIGELGYSFGANGVPATGAFTWSTNNLPALTSDGDAVTYFLSGNGRSLVGRNSAGERVISIQLTDLSTGTYKVAIAEPLDHRHTGLEDDINLSVGYTITDTRGLTASGTLRVVVDDDSPVTSSDVAATDSDTAVTVNVLANDQAGADGLGSVSAVVQDGASVGQVRVNSNGTLTFTPSPGFSGDAVIEYTVTDGDGDTSTNTLTVSVDEGAPTGPTTPETDGDPSTTAPTVTVDEDGLAGGSPGGFGDVPGMPISVVGQLGYDFGEAGQPASGGFSWSLDGLPSLTTDGKTVTYNLSGNGRSLIGFDGHGNRVISIQLTDIASGTYKVVLSQPLDHPSPVAEDDIVLDVGYTVTDAEGSTASGRLNVLIDDDTPVTVDDSLVVDDNSPTTVDVTANDTFGGDGGSLLKATVTGGSAVGSVSVNDDNTLTFTPAHGFEGTATITYTMIDNDGDKSSANLFLTVTDDGIVPTTPETDGDPSTTSPVVHLDDEGLGGGIEGGEGDVPGTSIKSQGILGYDFGEDGPAGQGAFTWVLDNLPALTSAGSAVSYSVVGNGLVLLGTDSTGAQVLKASLANLATGEYSVELSKVLDHPNTTTEDNISIEIGYALTDGDGDSVRGKLTVVVNDDSPEIFVADSSIMEDGATGGINFAVNAGADGDSSVVFDNSIEGAKVTDGAGNDLGYLGQELTYSLSNNGKVLSAVTGDDETAFSITLSSDGSTYSVNTNSFFSVGETSHALISTGTAAENRSFIAYNVADADAGNDILISSRGHTVVRSDNKLGVAGSDIGGDESIRIDFLNNAIISDSSASWSSHQSISRYEQVIHVDGSSTSSATLTLSAFAFESDANGGSGVPSLDSGSLINLSAGDISVYDSVGVNVTSEVNLSDSGNGILIDGVKDGWRVELESHEPFQAVKLTNGGGDDFTLGGLEYRSGGDGGDLDISYDLVGTDGDGDTASGALVLTAEGESRSHIGGPGDDNIYAAGGDDIIIGDMGGRGEIIQDGKDYNLSLIIDFSHSLYNKTDVVIDGDVQRRIDLLHKAVNDYLESLKDHVGTINLNLVKFSNDAWSFEYEDVTGFESGNSKIKKVQDFFNGSWPSHDTNFECAFRKSETWFKKVSADDIENQAIFFTDGTPDWYMDGDNNNKHKSTYQETTQVTMQESVDAFRDLTQYTDVHAIGWDENPPSLTRGGGDDSEQPVAETTPFFDNTNPNGESTIILDDGTSFTGPVGEAAIVDDLFELSTALQNGRIHQGYIGVGDDYLSGDGGDDIIFGDSTNSDSLSWTNSDTGVSFASGSHDGMGYRGVVEFLKWSEVHGNGEAPTGGQVRDYIRYNYESLLETTRTQGGDDILKGGSGDDILVGGGGADTFVFSLGDEGDALSPATDVIADFSRGTYRADGTADRIDLSDLLDDASESDITDFIVAEQSGADAVLSIKTDGGVSADGDNADQVVILSNVSMGMSGENFIDNLISHNQLEVE